MKNSLALSVALLLAAAVGAPAAITNVYVQNWGTGNSGVTGDGNINTVGWTGIAVSQTAGPYLGIYPDTGATDPSTGESLPANTVYFTILLPNQNTPGMFYTTTEAGTGAGGNSSFTAIDPTAYTNLTLSVEVRNTGGNPTNYFAVRVGGSWYVSVTPLAQGAGLVDPQFTNAAVPYTNIASAWLTLTLGSTNVTIGSTPGGNLIGSITGIGIVQLPTTGGLNYNKLAVTAFVPGGGPPPTPPTITAGTPVSQTAYAGGGAQFRVQASGTAPLIYLWYTNGVQLTDGSKYSGTGTNLLTISNVSAADAAVTYTIIVSNAAPTAATNSAFTLTVNTPPADYLYAETYPYIGPSGNLPIGGVGWQSAFQGTTGLFQSGTGNGVVFSYSGVATTNIYYATTTGDTGASGLPFLTINPDSYAHVTFRASFSPGNGAGLNSSNVVAYYAVQMAGANWYVAAKRIPVQTLMQNSYQPYEMAFTRTASNWNTLTINANTATVGAAAGSPLAGNITGAGIVIAHLGLFGGGDFNWDDFVLTTNDLSITPPSIGLSGSPNSQDAPAGGGVSFGVSVTGTAPFTYGWSLQGTNLTNGGRISGANTATLTIANLTTNDAGEIVALVTNAANSDRSDIYTTTLLTVTNPAVGILYSETFPFVGPSPGNYPITSAGWTEAVPTTPNTLYQNLGSDGAVFAFLGGAGTTAFYTTTTSDTNQAGLPFPGINTAFYSDITFSVDIAPQFNPSNVTAYLAVRMDTNWYVAVTAFPVPTAASSTFSTYTRAFNAGAANWKNLTITSSGALIGSTASANLQGLMTGAGLVFVNTGSGTLNFDNFIVTGSGLGGINVGPVNAGSFNLSWVGNPAVNLQTITNIAATNWTDVPNTLGLYSQPVQVTEPKRFFRLVKH